MSISGRKQVHCGEQGWNAEGLPKQSPVNSHGAQSVGIFGESLSCFWSLRRHDMIFHRKTAVGQHDGVAQTAAQRRGLLIGVSLVNSHHRTMWIAGKRQEKLFDRGAF